MNLTRKSWTLENYKLSFKKKVYELKLKYLEETNTFLAQTKDKNNGRIPHKMVCNIVQSSVVSQPWITRHVINSSFKKNRGKQAQSVQAAEESVPSALDNSPSDSHTGVALILTHMHDDANIKPTTDDLEESNAGRASDSNDLQESNENRRKGG